MNLDNREFELIKRALIAYSLVAQAGSENYNEKISKEIEHLQERIEQAHKTMKESKFL